ncbi:unnamed protein product [Discosporangium mesarthrocarpum]
MLGASPHTIWVQQDSAKLHARNGVIAATEAAPGENIELDTQLPNSPDLSVLDPGFFHFIPRLEDDLGVTNVRELVEATIKALDDYPQETLKTVSFCYLW